MYQLDAAKLSHDQYGSFLWRMHSVPTEWVEPHLAILIEHVPALANISPGSHVRIVPRPDFLKQQIPPGSLQILSSLDMRVHLATEAAKRVVPMHGDYHAQNVVTEGENAKAIDLEFTSVGLAVFDLGAGSGPGAWLSADVCLPTVQGYLEACGDSASAADLWLDVCVARFWP